MKWYLTFDELGMRMLDWSCTRWLWLPLCLIHRVGSIEPFENPSDTRKLESSSYHALGACLRPYNAFLRCRYNTDEVLPALIQSMQNQPGFFDVLWFRMVVKKYAMFAESTCHDDDASLSFVRCTEVVIKFIQLEEHFLDFVDWDLNVCVQVPLLNIVDRDLFSKNGAFDHFPNFTVPSSYVDSWRIIRLADWCLDEVRRLLLVAFVQAHRGVDIIIPIPLCPELPSAYANVSQPD
ncbi:hypothetical protein Tco_0001592 [Tanacetum coccineum]